MNEIFCLFFCTKHSKSDMYFIRITAHLNPDSKLSQKILDVYFNITKFTDEKMD